MAAGNPQQGAACVLCKRRGVGAAVLQPPAPQQQGGRARGARACAVGQRLACVAAAAISGVTPRACVASLCVCVGVRKRILGRLDGAFCSYAYGLWMGKPVFTIRPPPCERAPGTPTQGRARRKPRKGQHRVRALLLVARCRSIRPAGCASLASRPLGVRLK